MHHLLAYADRWSVSSGQNIQFFVSSPKFSYAAQLVRLRQPEAGPLASPFCPEELSAPFNGQHRGRLQSIPIGSLAVVPRFEGFCKLEEFTILAIIYPTAPEKGRQALLGTWCEGSQTGLGLEIGEDAALNLRGVNSDGNGFILSTTRPLEKKKWHLVSVSFGRNNVVLSQISLARSGGRAHSVVRVSKPRCEVLNCSADAIFSIAAWRNQQTSMPSSWQGWSFSHHFNGKVEAPQVLGHALEWADLLDAFKNPRQYSNRPVFAAWDFSRNIPEDSILDVGPNLMHGLLINIPTRGVTGHNWSGEVFHWRHAPEQYGAIHFHDDDLADACWSADFEFHVPADMKSGVYAVRLSDDEAEFWVPFIVRPPPGKPGSKTALLLSTTTYLAYLNHRSRFMSLAGERLHGRLRTFDAIDISFIDTPRMGLSTYDRHSDGSGVTYASRLRPGYNFRPTGNLWNFSLDLFLVEWLDQVAGAFDVLTDEDLHREGAALLEGYRVVLTGSHPEYVSMQMLDALETYLEGDGRLMYMGGNGFYWRTIYNPHANHLIEIRRSEGVRSWDTEPGEQASSFTGENSGLWRKNGRPPQILVGNGYVAQGFNRCSYYALTASSDDPRISWALKSVGGRFIGDNSVLLGGAAGLEIDAANENLGTPAHALVIARSEKHTNAYELAGEEVLTPHGATDGLSTVSIHADMMFFETPNGGAVFSTGSIAYAAALGWNNYNNDLCRLTTNILRRFQDEASFEFPCSPSDGSL